MKFIYKPEGVEPMEFDFAPGKLRSPEAEAIEKVTGLYLPAWQEAAGEGSQRALRAFLWVMLKRKQPTLKFDQVDVAADEMELVWETDEVETVIKSVYAERAKGPLSDEQTATLETFCAIYEDLTGEAWTAPEESPEDDGEPVAVEVPKAKKAG
jgi:hypothetical protein